MHTNIQFLPKLLEMTRSVISVCCTLYKTFSFKFKRWLCKLRISSLISWYYIHVYFCNSHLKVRGRTDNMVFDENLRMSVVLVFHWWEMSSKMGRGTPIHRLFSLSGKAGSIKLTKCKNKLLKAHKAGFDFLHTGTMVGTTTWLNRMLKAWLKKCVFK